MLTSIGVFDAFGHIAITLPLLGGTSERPYIIKDIQGLSPVKADIYMATDIGVDGSHYRGSRVPPRNVVLKIGYNPAYLAVKPFSVLRQELYNVFPPKGDVRLRFRSNDFPTVDLRGYVESHETSMFSESPEVVVSIIFAEPYFKEMNDTVLTGQTDQWINTNSGGNAPTGFVIRVGPLYQPTKYITISTGKGRFAKFTRNWIDHDILVVSTVKGNKYARSERYDNTYNRLDSLSSGDLSLMLDSSADKIIAQTDGTMTSSAKVEVTYVNSYLGI